MVERIATRLAQLARIVASVVSGHGTGRPNAKTTHVEVTSLPTLKRLGLTPNQSSDFQKLAAIPEPEFERRVKNARGDRERMTTRRILEPTPKQRFDPFADERRIWSPVSEWLRGAASLPDATELKTVRPTGGSADAIRDNLKTAERYIAELRRLREGGWLWRHEPKAGIAAISLVEARQRAANDARVHASKKAGIIVFSLVEERAHDSHTPRGKRADQFGDWNSRLQVRRRRRQ